MTGKFCCMGNLKPTFIGKAIGRTLHAMIIFTIVQALGFILIMAGMYLTANGILNPTVLVQTRMSDVCIIPSAIVSPVAFLIAGIILFSKDTVFPKPVWTLVFLQVPTIMLVQD
ncbi:leukocyte surface antigen CD47-like protein [Cricetulus griseus]|uniref:Leukocyte surface antigen CD47-like protein n=1 Tax=Cricetulus griseus TaxID=10029 RepID=A0A061I7W0_CRIGR|nr:leukocyte surface antigen CD47-like protein [Cricetulus griseus]